MRTAFAYPWIGSYYAAILLQATKEAEYRDKVADLKARIDSCTARRNAEQEHEATAKVGSCTACGGTCLSLSNV